MPVNLTISDSLRNTAYDSVDGKSDHSDAEPCSGNYSDSSRLTQRDTEPFRQLERQYVDLFSSREIQEVDESQLPNIQGKKIKSVDLDECEVINTSRDGFDWIGTQGLSTCIGICARGMTGQNEIILGVSHYTGIDKEPAEALQELRNKMDAQGARCSKMYLIGGAMSADPQLSTAEKERIMLSLRHEFNIQGVRLHPNICEDINADDHVNLLMTPDHIYFSTEGLFDSD